MSRRGGTSRECAGFAIVTAVFIVIALAVLAVAIVGVVTTQQTSSSLDMAGARAYQAATAGAEAGAYNSLRNNACAAQAIAFGGTLSAYTANVTCARSTHDNEAGIIVTIDTITSTACDQPPCPAATPGASYSERQITVTVGQP